MSRTQLLSISLHFFGGSFLDGPQLVATDPGAPLPAEQEVETPLHQLFWQSLRFTLIGLAWLT